MTDFDSIAHPRASSGVFVDKPQSAPQVALTAADPTPANAAWEKARSAYWDAGRNVLDAGVSAMKEAIRNAAPNAATAEFEIFDDIDASSLDFVRLLDEDGNEIPIDQYGYDDIRDYLDVIGDEFNGSEDARNTELERVVNEEGRERFTLRTAADEGRSTWAIDREISAVAEAMNEMVERKNALALEGLSQHVRHYVGNGTAALVERDMVNGRLAVNQIVSADGAPVWERGAAGFPADFESKLDAYVVSLDWGIGSERLGKSPGVDITIAL
ncbi:hypothetical protein F1C58_16675 (plasmid) [Glaciihabitans sp. INWT7]|uniref:hypothetical protein n=1 Tax=Glaciihabitans sp. INWT7 TaxID=2596912 RepID=UPI001627B83A|nr:hypothetical protein [Glaciihabitans sp. INWT7]QNE48692.1 hypothetical protein F1C58_16675 [Glaciihabitans sp. INWT7]